MSATHPHVLVIQSLYQAFGRGDVPAILSHVAEDATWCNIYGKHLFPGEWGKSCTSHDEITGFFQTIHEMVEVHGFEPQEFIAERDKVVVLIRWRGIVRQSGHPFDTLIVHIWTLSDGKITDYIGLDDPTIYGF